MATVTVKNVGKVTSHLNKIANMDLKDKMNIATALVHGQAKALAPVDTGNLAGSIHMKVTKRGNNWEGRVYTNLQYAPFVEFGTGIKGDGTYPYKVKGLNLTYRDTPWVYTTDNENFYYTKGQVAQPYMYPALEQNKKNIRNIFKQKVKEQLKGGK